MSRFGGLGGFKKLGVSVKMTNRMTREDRIRKQTETLLRKEARQADRLLFAQRRHTARRDTCAYLSALLEDDKMLRLWADSRVERHVWVEAAIHLEAAWHARGDPDFFAAKARIREIGRSKARLRIRQGLAEICVRRAEVHRIAASFFAQVAPSLDKKTKTLKKRLTKLGSSSGKGAAAHSQMITAVKTLQVEILKNEEQLQKLEQLIIELNGFSKTEQKELKKSPSRWKALLQREKELAKGKLERMVDLQKIADVTRGDRPHRAPIIAVSMEDLDANSDEEQDFTDDVKKPTVAPASAPAPSPAAAPAPLATIGGLLGDSMRPPPSLTDAMVDFRLAEDALSQAKALRGEVANVEAMRAELSELWQQLRTLHKQSLLEMQEERTREEAEAAATLAGDVTDEVDGEQAAIDALLAAADADDERSLDGSLDGAPGAAGAASAASASASRPASSLAQHALEPPPTAGAAPAIAAGGRRPSSKPSSEQPAAAASAGGTGGGAGAGGQMSHAERAELMAAAHGVPSSGGAGSGSGWECLPIGSSHVMGTCVEEGLEATFHGLHAPSTRLSADFPRPSTRLRLTFHAPSIAGTRTSSSLVRWCPSTRCTRPRWPWRRSRARVSDARARRRPRRCGCRLRARRPTSSTTAVTTACPASSPRCCRRVLLIASDCF